MKAIDVMGFAGSMAAGVDQAGFEIIGKREPAKFGGFGMNSMLYNMPWVEGQVADPENWDLPTEQVELVYGCPPCSGFSGLSVINTVVHGTTYGIDADINECMVWLIDYASRVKPPVIIMESVGPAFKVGRPWMEHLYDRLLAQTGLPYMLTHVNMDAGLVGGDVNRKRYFFVAHLQPFGVGLDFVTPRTMIEVIGDLGHDEDEDVDWGHQTLRNAWSRRHEDTIKWLKEQGRDWLPGTRLPDNTVGLEAPDFWRREKPLMSKRAGNEGYWKNYDPHVYAAWYSTDAFTTVRWRGDRVFGVVVAATMGRAVHPEADRNLTYREAARFMSLPDTWSLRWLVESKKDAELGKAVPTASAKWIAHWAKMSLEGTPGEYAGVADTDDPNVRVISVNSKNNIAAIGSQSNEGWWDNAADPDPATWLVDRKARPGEWWQREDELGIFVPKPVDIAVPKEQRMPKASKATQGRKTSASKPTIERIAPEVVAALLDELGLSKADAAQRLGVSTSRIHEITTHVRPKSWLNADRWESVQAALRGEAA